MSWEHACMSDVSYFLIASIMESLILGMFQTGMSSALQARLQMGKGLLHLVKLAKFRT